MKKFLSLLLSLAMLLSVAALADETHGNYSAVACHLYGHE